MYLIHENWTKIKILKVTDDSSAIGRLGNRKAPKQNRFRYKEP